MRRPKPWPEVADALPDDGCCYFPADLPVAATNTACKHGVGECELCGTTGQRDELHTTTGGVGVVGRLRKKK